MPADAAASRVTNVLTVDVEDYFHVSAMEPLAPRDRWSSFESRVVNSTQRVLDLMAEAHVTGTFFILGWVADQYPSLVRRIVAGGHEIASHSYWHRLVYRMTPQQFRDDLRRAKTAIEAAAGVAVYGFRAPSFSITEDSLWAFDVLVDEGYRYDASVFPIRHDRYGIPSAPREAHRVTRAGGSLLEIPATAGRIGSMALPIGGGYFRLMPYALTRWAIGHLNRAGQPAMFYTHPWEFDPDQPRLPASPVVRLRHYNHLAQTAPRFQRMLAQFQFGPISSVFNTATERTAVSA
jgi:polysaccharide deacetylase family protein (PEP-CTERM system associated)